MFIKGYNFILINTEIKWRISRNNITEGKTRKRKKEKLIFLDMCALIGFHTPNT